MSTCPNAVVMITDRGYLPPAIFVASQLLSQRRQNFDIVILTIGCTPTEGMRLDPRLKFIDFALDGRVPTSSSRADRSAATYGRLSLDAVLPPNYKKILYLDADIWIGDRDVGQLFDVDMGGCPMAAVRAPSEIYRPNEPEWLEYKRKLGLDASTVYFNAGVMLIDRDAFAACRIAEDTLTYLAEGRYVGRLDDQSALNAVVNGNWRELSPVWNWTFSGRPWLVEEFQPGIIHFIGSSKPWKDHKGHHIPQYSERMRRYFEGLGYPDYVKAMPAYLSAKRVAADALLRAKTAIGLDDRSRAVRDFMRDIAPMLPRLARAPNHA